MRVNSVGRVRRRDRPGVVGRILRRTGGKIVGDRVSIEGDCHTFFCIYCSFFVGFSFHARQASLDLVQLSVGFRKRVTGTAVRRLRLRL